MSQPSSYLRVYSKTGAPLILVSVPGTFWWAGEFQTGSKDISSFLAEHKCSCQNSPQELILLHYAVSLGIFWARFIEGNHICKSAKLCLQVSEEKKDHVKIKHTTQDMQLGVLGMWWCFKGISTKTPICWQGCSGAIPCRDGYHFPVDYLYRIGSALVRSLRMKWPLLVLPLCSSNTRGHYCLESLEIGHWIGARINYELFGSSCLVVIIHELLKQKLPPGEGCWMYTSYCSHKVSEQEAKLPLVGVETMCFSTTKYNKTPNSLGMGKYKQVGRELHITQYHLRITEVPSLACCFQFLVSSDGHDEGCCREKKGPFLSLTFYSHSLPEVFKKFPLRLAYPCKVYKQTNLTIILAVEVETSFFIFLSADAK